MIGNLADGLIVKVLDEGGSTIRRLWPAMFAVIGVASWKAAGIVLRRSAAGWLQYRTQKDVRLRLIDHMLRLELSWFRRQSVGDGGRLSAGERQLVALVRAWISEPDVLVLDEATSAVDPALEVRLRRAIERLTDSDGRR